MGPWVIWFPNSQLRQSQIELNSIRTFAIAFDPTPRLSTQDLSTS